MCFNESPLTIVLPPTHGFFVPRYIIDSKWLQPLNVFPPRTKTVDGMMIDVKLVHSENTLVPPMVVSPS